MEMAGAGQRKARSDGIVGRFWDGNQSVVLGRVAGIDFPVYMVSIDKYVNLPKLICAIVHLSSGQLAPHPPL